MSYYFDDELSLEKYQPLHVEGKYQELLDLVVSVEGKVARYWEISSLYRLGKYEEALEKGLSYGVHFKEGVWKGRYLARIGVIYYYTGETALGLKYIDWSFKVFLEVGDPRYLWIPLHSMGFIYDKCGEHDRALEYYKQSLLITKKSGDEWSEAYILANMGFMGINMGEIDEAQKNIEESLELFIKQNDTYGVVGAKAYLSKIYFSRGDWDRSIEYRIPQYNFFKERGNLRMKSVCLLGLIICELKRDRERAKQYLEELEKIENSEDDHQISLNFKFASALFFKSSNRSRDKTRAELLFEELINCENVFIKYQSIMHLIELLLVEYKTYAEKDVLDDINLYLETLNEYAKRSHLYPLLLKSQIIKSQLELIEGNFELAEKILEKAKQLAKEKNLKMLLQEVVDVQDNMVQELQEMKILIKKNANIAERLEKSSLLSYIKKAQRLMIE